MQSNLAIGQIGLRVGRGVTDALFTDPLAAADDEGLGLGAAGDDEATGGGDRVGSVEAGIAVGLGVSRAPPPPADAGGPPVAGVRRPARGHPGKGGGTNRQHRGGRDGRDPDGRPATGAAAPLRPDLRLHRGQHRRKRLRPARDFRGRLFRTTRATDADPVRELVLDDIRRGRHEDRAGRWRVPGRHGGSPSRGRGCVVPLDGRLLVVGGAGPLRDHQHGAAGRPLQLPKIAQETDPLVTGAGLDDVQAARDAKVALSSVSTSFGAVPSGSGKSLSRTVGITSLTGCGADVDLDHHGRQRVRAGQWDGQRPGHRRGDADGVLQPGQGDREG